VAVIGIGFAISLRLVSEHGQLEVADPPTMFMLTTQSVTICMSCSPSLLVIFPSFI
jgi:hypothetical protein